MKAIKDFVRYYWFVLLFLPLVLYLYYANSFDPQLIPDLVFRKLSIALASLGFGYLARRLIIGKIDWQGVWQYVYAIVLQLIVALAFIFG
ncbi:hypothetical protein [uncultured virus]|uniref:Uncharacterized protein n=1 Tax=uncultured virus TaxID=340016 RepID=A0A5Q0TWV0_9VIRU|nr:hypothetical protein [uncultured virus]